MQPLTRSTCLAFSLSLVAAGCSDQTQFSSAGGGSPGSDSTAADATAEDTDGIPGSDVSYSGDAGSSQVADAALDPSDVNSGGKPLAAPVDKERFQALCSQGTQKTITQKIRFPETQNCRFGTAGNLDRKNGNLQAMEAQTTSIALPQKTLLCGVSVNSDVSTIQYDDFMILTLNGYVLMSSNRQILQGLEGGPTTAYKWDFGRIRGMPVDFNSPAYCMGSGDSVCKIPVTDSPGQFQFKVDPGSLIHLADQIAGTALNFALVATGDNDDRDCWHTDLSLDFTLQYVEAP